jgi:hypothetical protein
MPVFSFNHFATWLTVPVGKLVVLRPSQNKALADLKNDLAWFMR